MKHVSSFSVIGYVPVVQKDTFIHMCDWAHYVKEGFTLAQSGMIVRYTFIWLSLIDSILFSQLICIFFYSVVYVVLS